MTIKDPTSQTTLKPGQIWRPSKPGTGLRIVRDQVVEPDATTVSYRTLNGVFRRITRQDWDAWVARWGCRPDGEIV